MKHGEDILFILLWIVVTRFGIFDSTSFNTLRSHFDSLKKSVFT